MVCGTAIINLLFVLLPVLLIGLIIQAFRESRRKKTVLDHIRILRRSIGAACFLGFLLMAFLPAQAKGAAWNYGGFLLFFVSAIHYGYAQKVEKAAKALETPDK